MTTYLIIGNGVAGNAAAENIRKLDPEGKIVMFSKEARPFYYVPALPEYVAGDKASGPDHHPSQDWYDQRRIELHLATPVTQIDAAQKLVETDKGERFPFDKLLLATGGKSFIPPMQGADSPGVFTLKTLADADRIKQAAAGAKTAVLDRRAVFWGSRPATACASWASRLLWWSFFPGCCPGRWMWPVPPSCRARWRTWALAFISEP